jgi:hypothetical protein
MNLFSPPSLSSEPEAARIAGRSATNRPGSVHHVALGLRKERQRSA